MTFIMLCCASYTYFRITNLNKMKKLLFPILLFGNIVFSQVGIETDTPQTTLDINGSIQLRSDLKVNGSDSTEGDTGSKGQALVSQGEGQPAVWKDVLVPFLEENQYQLINSHAKIDNTGISFPTGPGDGVKTNQIDDELDSNWMILQDLNSEITVENPDNKISLIFQSGVELSRTTLENQNIRYICAVFFNGKLKAMRSNQIDAIPNKQKNQSMITLAYNIFNLAPGDYEVQVGCRKVSTTNNYLRLAIGRPSEGSGNAQTNNFSMQSFLKIDVIEKVHFIFN